MLVHVMICSLWGYLPRSICVLCIQRIAYYICESYIFINGLGGMRGGGWVNSVMGKMVREGVNSRNWSVGTRGLYVRKFTSLSVGRRVQTVLSSAAIAVVRGSTPVRPNFSMTELLFIHCTFGFIISYFMHNSTFDYMLVHVMICSLWGYLPRSICVLCIPRMFTIYVYHIYSLMGWVGGRGGVGWLNCDMRKGGSRECGLEH